MEDSGSFILSNWGGSRMEVDKRRKSMLKVTAGSVFAHLEYPVIVNKDLLILSSYERSQMAVNGVCANIGLRIRTDAYLKMVK